MAYLNSTSTGFFPEDLNASPPRFKLYRNQGVANYVDYEVLGEFSGRGALRFENFVYPSTPQRIFRIFASSVFPPLQISDSALKLTPPDGWSGKEVRVKVLVKTESFSPQGVVLFYLGGLGEIITFSIMRNGLQFFVGIDYWLNFPTDYYQGIIREITQTNTWYLVDYQVKLNPLNTRELFAKLTVVPVILDANGNFVGFDSANTTSIFDIFVVNNSTQLWGVNPIEVQGTVGNPVGIWFDNLSVGQGEGITEL
jgi:hypothetical protein